MRTAIQKSFRFEAAHRLVKGYCGKCAHLHGHSYVVTVQVEGDAKLLDAVDMVMDFNDLRPVKEWIDSTLDHATLVAESDTALIEWLKQNNQKHVVLPGNPTSELLAMWIGGYIQSALGISVASVSINETCLTQATVRFHN